MFLEFYYVQVKHKLFESLNTMSGNSSIVHIQQLNIFVFVNKYILTMYIVVQINKV